ncbi:hypothetical protein [Amycolatopsis saalfeldensis]|uniref:Uncharacterized protein n=1 Tax=Amycolatopsis saalfeldensis TaxID=394193 RepID=A0A1H8Y4F1_9PSEU|nr:hypothetical protein [Amycolatopsis saalfeldensis]SEP46989.1 hypothetical protein SAMN04489732_11111 [Amycolatopsis saalfeldensis]
MARFPHPTSVVRLAGASTEEVLGALNGHAVQLTARDATDDEIASLRECAEKLAVIDNTDRTIEDLRTFMRRVVGGLHAERLAVVEGIESRSAERAAEAVDALSARTAELVRSTSRAKTLLRSDPGYAHLLIEMLNARLGSVAG